MLFSVQIAEIPKKSINIGEFWTRIAKDKQTFETKSAKLNAKMFDEF